jgi:hypothetical protein
LALGIIESNLQTQDASRVMHVNPVTDTLIHAQGVFSSGVDLVRHCDMPLLNTTLKKFWRKGGVKVDHVQSPGLTDFATETHIIIPI